MTTLNGRLRRSRAEAVVGWRYWQLSGAGRLRSVTQRRIEWRPGTVMLARCLGAGHPAPDEGCDCGIYGARDLASLREHGLCLAPEAVVVGRVALWGTVLDDVSGWRAEVAAPVDLWVVADLVPPAGLDATVAALGTYGVPVGTMPLAEAVAGVSAAILANQAMAATTARPRPLPGPPTDLPACPAPASDSPVRAAPAIGGRPGICGAPSTTTGDERPR
ncbi:MAG: hypothetical protein ABR511_03205 [Acidimicrobiales bacterium]